jgi:hypothetical protein
MPQMKTWHFDLADAKTRYIIGEAWDTMTCERDDATVEANKLRIEEEERTGRSLIAVNFRELPSAADHWVPGDDPDDDLEVD